MTYPATQTFWLSPLNVRKVGLRRYSAGPDISCTAGGKHGNYHSTINWIGEEPYEPGPPYIERPLPPTDHPDWPRTCECGYTYVEADHWQVFTEPIYVRSDTGEQATLRDAPPGACWDAHWMNPIANPPRPDGIYLMVRCPNGRDWEVDSQASNCTRKGEPHTCWCRHGDPRECKVTVDKNPTSPDGTCQAGGGSILAGDYHGFLSNGILTEG